MKRILKLTESDLVRIIGKIINEQPDVDFLVKKSHNKIDELEFTEKDYFNYKECKRKKRTFPNYIPTEEERLALNKYYRQMAKGLDPAGPFKGKGRKEEPFTEEEYFNYKEYKRKKRTSPNYNPTEEERVAYNKYYRQKLKGLDSIALFRKQQDPHIMEKIIKLTKSDLRLLIEQIINERKQVGVLYHNTLMERLFKIIQENRLKVNSDDLSNIINFRSKRDDNLMFHPLAGPILKDRSKIPPSISFTRNKQYKRYDDEVVIVLDGDKLSERYRITPYSNFGGRKHDEMEERVFRDVVNLDKYIIKIILPYESKRMESLLNDRGIPYEIDNRKKYGK